MGILCAQLEMTEGETSRAACSCLQGSAKFLKLSFVSCSWVTVAFTTYLYVFLKGSSSLKAMIKATQRSKHQSF